MQHWSMTLVLLVAQFYFNPSYMQTTSKDRHPAVAGTFYPSEQAQLKKMVGDFLLAGKKRQSEDIVRALIVPHAGYVFSGGVAASGFNQIDPDHPYKRVFILASSHRVSLGKASVYTQGDYITPFGKLEVDREISNQLAKNQTYFTSDPVAHIQEHSIEVQLPFLQMVLKKPFKIVPVVLASQVPGVSEGVAEALKPFFTEENLFIVSADFSHYPAYENALKVDAATAKALCSNSIDEFLSVLKANEKLRIPELATSMCAWPSALVLLHLTQGNKSLKYNQIDYQNSGDIKLYGDKSGVVGYHAISVTEPRKNGFHLTAADKKNLLEIARNTVESYVRHRTAPESDPAGYSDNLHKQTGAFVTLKMEGQLRGCIGSFEPDAPLYQVVREMAIAASTRDSRFLPVQAKELNDIHIEISVLTPMHKINDIREIELGKHGIYIKKGYQGGTFLPQVATETGWTLEEFLGHCARDKAGIGWEGWRQADIFIYEALIFEEELQGK